MVLSRVENRFQINLQSVWPRRAAEENLPLVQSTKNRILIGYVAALTQEEEIPSSREDKME